MYGLTQQGRTRLARVGMVANATGRFFDEGLDDLFKGNVIRDIGLSDLLGLGIDLNQLALLGGSSNDGADCYTYFP